MAKCRKCGKSRHWKLADGRLKCRQCGHRFVLPISVWAASRLSERTKNQLLEWFVLGVPVYRQRFLGCASAPAAERFYRLLRAVCAHQEQLRGPLIGQLELDETTFGGARHGAAPDPARLHRGQRRRRPRAARDPPGASARDRFREG